MPNAGYAVRELREREREIGSAGSTRPNRASLFASIRSFLRLRRFDPSINRGLATSTSCPQPRMTSCTHAECVPTSITTRAAFNPWKKVAILLRCPQLPLRQHLPLQSLNAVIATLVAQIYAHRQTVEIREKLTALMLFSGARRCHLISDPAFLSAFPPVPPALLSYPAAPDPATSCASMSVHSSFQNCYASSRSISLAVLIAPSSALIPG